MVLKSDQQRMQALLKETITLLCKNGLHYKSEFCVEALIGITLDHDDVFLVNIKETIRDELKAAKELSQLTDVDGLEAPSPTSTETDRVPARRRRHSEREGRRARAENQTDTIAYEEEDAENATLTGQHCEEEGRYRLQLPQTEGVKQEDDGEEISCQLEQNETESTSEIYRKRRYQEDGEYSSQQNVKKKRHNNYDDQEDNSEDDDVVFIKDEPLSDSELQQVTLGIAQAQNNSMHQFTYQSTDHIAAPLSDLPTEPLAGCSNWSMPAGSGDGTPVSLGDPPGGGDQAASLGISPQAIQAPSPTSGSSPSRGFNTVTIASSTGKSAAVYQCLHCPYNSKWFSTIRRHVATHGERNIPCIFCDAKFCTTHSLTIHMSSVHRLRNVECICGRCSMSFSTTGLLREHLRKSHGCEGEEAHTYQCSKCSDAFQNAIELQVHWAQLHQHVNT